MGALTGLGFGILMLQDASRDLRQFPMAWKRAFWMTLLSGLSLWAIYAAVAPGVFGIPTSVLLYAAIGLPELVCFPLTVAASYAFQAHERLGWAGALQALIPLGNLIAVGAFLNMAPRYTLGLYLPFHAAASILAAVVGVVLARRLLAPAAVPLALQRRDVREAFGFSLMRMVDTGMTSLDKTLVLMLAGSEVAGIYSAAYRFVAVLAVPATSLGVAALPRLFRTHVESASSHSQLVRSLIVATVSYGAIAALAAWLIGGILPLLLGPAFGPAAQVARWLMLFPLLYGFYTLGCTVLITSDRRNLRLCAQALGIILLAGSALVCLPRFGLAGAAAMLLFSTAVTALVLWALVGLEPRVGGR